MALFTGKGDDGTTRLYGEQAKKFGCDQRISKSSSIAEALGSMDETGSFLGLCKSKALALGYKLDELPLSHIVHSIQKDLFIIQAELAGAEKTIEESKVVYLEKIIGDIEKKLPPIKSFFISGGNPDLEKDQVSGAELGALFDIARTIARRAERRVTAVVEENQDREGGLLVGVFTRKYLNRLSSILYALARYSNHSAGIQENSPDYK